MLKMAVFETGKACNGYISVGEAIAKLVIRT
jgi:hypothetical protein